MSSPPILPYKRGDFLSDEERKIRRALAVKKYNDKKHALMVATKKVIMSDPITREKIFAMLNSSFKATIVFIDEDEK